MKSKVIIRRLAAGFIIAAAVSANGASLVVDSVISETVGATAVITGSGNKTNTNTWSIGSVGQFVIRDVSTNQTFGLVISATGCSGVLASETDSLMVAQTVNSQGLTDNATLSIYVNPGDTSTVSGNWTLSLNLSFYELNSGGGSINLGALHTFSQLLLTSLDIDYNQKYYTSNSSFSSASTYPPS